MRNVSHLRNMSSTVPLNFMKKDSSVNISIDSETHLTTYQPLNTVQDSTDIAKPISYIEEALKGNLMPAIILLEKKQININAPISEQTGDTLLHLACFYSYYNVTRTLIEKFNAGINIQNYYKMTPLHIACNNKNKDIIILNYLLNKKDINIEAQDCNGLTPLSTTVINNFNLGFLFLISKGADINRLDYFQNNLLYFALVHNNIFVMNFLQKHSSNGINNYNRKFYSESVPLSDILITNKNIEPTQQIVYYYSKDINNESIEKCIKYPTEFPFYSRYNYEMLNTLLYYKVGDVRGFLYAMFPTICGCLRKRKRISRSKILSNYYQKLYEEVSLKKQTTNANSERSNNSNENIDSSLDTKNIYIKDDLVQTNDNMFYIFKTDNLTLFFVYNILYKKKHLIYIMISIFMLISFLLLFLFCNYNLVIVYGILLCMCMCYVVLFLLNKIGKSNLNNHPSYNLNDSFNHDNLLNVIKEKLSSNKLLELPLEQEICERCLITKKPTTFHCMTCDKCVSHFYFHSHVFNRCISKHNIRAYIGMMVIVVLFLMIVGIELIYNDKFVILKLIGTMYIMGGIIFLGYVIMLMICLMYNVSYHLMLNFHKYNDPYHSIQKRENEYVSIPHVYNVPWKRIKENIFGCN